MESVEMVELRQDVLKEISLAPIQWPILHGNKCSFWIESFTHTNTRVETKVKKMDRQCSVCLCCEELSFITLLSTCSNLFSFFSFFAISFNTQAHYNQLNFAKLTTTVILSSLITLLCRDDDLICLLTCQPRKLEGDIESQLRVS